MGDNLKDILEQSVRKEAYGTSIQKPLIRFIENIFLEMRVREAKRINGCMTNLISHAYLKRLI